MKHAKLWTLLGSMFLLLSCSGDKKSLKTLVIAVEGEPKKLDPRVALDAISWRMSYLYTQPLLNVGDNFLPTPALALSYENKGAKEFTFYLNPNAKFHDGSPVTSEDVRFSFEQYGSDNSVFKEAFSIVESMDSTEEHVFKMKLKEPKVSFLTGDIPVVRILPKHLALAEGYSQNPVGSGPYKFVKKDGRDFILEKNEHYPGNEKLFFNKVIVRVIEDPTTRYLSLVKGAVDIVFNAINSDKIVEIENNDDELVLHKGPGNTYQYLLFNFKNEKFTNPKIRQALAYAINREEIVKFKLKGLAKLANSVISPNNFYHNKEALNYPFDLAKAKQLLKEAGAQDLAIEVKTSTNKESNAIVRIIKDHWEKAGVKVTVKPAEFATYFADIKSGNFEVGSMRWAGVSDPSMLYDVFHSKNTPPGRNRGRYNSKELDDLLEKAQKTVDLKERKKLFDQVQKQVSVTLPYISLWYPDNVVVSQKDIANFSIHPTGLWSPILKASRKN